MSQRNDTYHDGLQPLANPPLPISPLIELLFQGAQLILILPHFCLGLLTAQHGAFERSICCLALEVLALGGEGVELVDLITDGTVATVGAAGRRNQSVDRVAFLRAGLLLLLLWRVQAVG